MIWHSFNLIFLALHAICIRGLHHCDKMTDQVCAKCLLLLSKGMPGCKWSGAGWKYCQENFDRPDQEKVQDLRLRYFSDAQGSEMNQDPCEHWLYH